MVAFVSSTTHAHVASSSRASLPSIHLHLEHRSNAVFYGNSNRQTGGLSLLTSSNTVSVPDQARHDRAAEARKRVLQAQQARAINNRASGMTRR